MARASYLFTSESVSEGHPDKVCDRISDEIVDLYFREGAKAGIDPYQIRVACETLATTNRVVVAGEVRGPTLAPAQIEETIRQAIKDIGYEQDGFHWKNAQVEILLHAQSADIAQGVDSDGNKDEGAGDQGIMFGYACRETPELMPAPILYAHRILKLLSDARRSGAEKALGPDAKSQVTVRYENGKPVGVTQVVVSHQHVDESLTSDDMRRLIEPYVAKALPQGWLNGETVWHINPTGKFFIGGPDGDCGLTGRKIIVDTYGGGGAPWRRRVLGQGPDQGRPLGRLCRALSRQERRQGGSRGPLHVAALLCHRRRRAAVDLRRPARHGHRRSGQARGCADERHAALAARHPRAPQAQSADLRGHLGLRPLRPRADRRGELLVGSDRPCGHACRAFQLRPTPPTRP